MYNYSNLAGGDTNLRCLRWCNVLEFGLRWFLGTTKQRGDSGGCRLLTPSLRRLMGVVLIIGDGLGTS
jgi:hypothetical protein